jgi:arylsulfatase A-like enzyme
MMTRSLSVLFALSLLPGIMTAQAAAEKPNIVFFFTDDQTSSTLGCYGHPIVQTPNIDSLASRGTRFQNSFVSQAICWVSRTSILTGLTGRSFGTKASPDQVSPENAQTFYPDLLRAAGYRTGHFGKWHTKLPKGRQPADHFDVFEDIGRNPYFKKMPDGTLRHETDLIVDRGIDFLKQQPKGTPFALNLWFNASHAEDNDRRPGIGFYPWPPSADGLYEDLEMYRPRLDDPAIFASLPDFYQSSLSRERYFWALNTEQKYQTNVRAYLRMATGIDNAVGRFIKALEEAGLADNTIIIYSADNGYHLGNRGLTGKWSHFEESLRVPLIIADPRVERPHQGKVSEAMVLNLDLPATFLDYAGVPIPEKYQGRSLKPIIAANTPADWRKETYHEHFAVRNRIPPWEGLRTERYKYANCFDHDYEFLYDLKADPDELKNLAADPAHAETLQQLRARTAQYVAQYGGSLPPREGDFEASTDAHPVASAAVGAKTDADGFVNLLNGRNLNGWEGDPQHWSFKEGALTGVTDGSLKMNRFITWTGSTLRNFDLRVKVKVTAGGNSGLQYRGAMRPEIGQDIVSGYQCDVVANNPDYNGMLYEERGRRILSHTGEKVIVAPDGQPWIVGQMEVKSFAPDEWHDYRVLVRGNHHQHWIDGHLTADLIDFDEKGRALEGVLAVQVHVGPAMKIQYKDFKIKHLPDDLPLLKAEDHPIPTGSLGVKPQGKLPKDWQPPVYGGH